MILSSSVYNENLYYFVFFFVVFVSYILYIFLNKDLFNDIKKSDIHIQKQIKQTMHEINTPLSTIKLNTKMLLNKISDQKNINRINRIEQSCNNLLDMYNNLQYDLEKQIDKIEYEEFFLIDALNQSINNFLDIKGEVDIHTNVNKDIKIYSDKNGFLIILNNIISNALKYNKNNNRIKIYTKDNTLFIYDNGIGIDIKNIFKIYDTYYQADTNFNGYGLGLSIVKEFCDKYNIKLKIDSKIDNYTSVELNLTQIIK